jgi:regulator of replication initiation timing
VLRLAEENDKLNAELKAMTERLAAAERRTQQILEARQRQQQQQSMAMNAHMGEGGANKSAVNVNAGQSRAY